MSTCTCSSLLSLYLCCLLLLSLCFAVYGVPASVVNVSTSAAIMQHLYMNTWGSQRTERILLMFHQRCCCLLKKAEQVGDLNREGGESGAVCIVFSFCLSVQQIFNYNHFSMIKIFYNCCSFFVIYSFFSSSVLTPLLFAGEMCWNSVKM